MRTAPTPLKYYLNFSRMNFPSFFGSNFEVSSKLHSLRTQFNREYNRQRKHPWLHAALFKRVGSFPTLSHATLHLNRIARVKKVCHSFLCTKLEEAELKWMCREISATLAISGILHFLNYWSFSIDFVWHQRLFYDCSIFDLNTVWPHVQVSRNESCW